MKILYVITTGGFTNRKFASGISEAGMMANYLVDRLSDIQIHFDQDARTTNENVYGVKRILEKNQLNPILEKFEIMFRERKMNKS